MSDLLINNESKYTLTDTDIKIRPCWKRYFGPIKAGSLRGSIIAMASITFGGGCLSFPSAVSQSGPVISFLIFCFVALISYYTLFLIINDGKESGIYDYNILVEKSLGKNMVLFSDINNLLLCTGCIISYQITVYQFALEIGYDFFNFEKSETNRLYVILICMFIIQIPLNCLKNIATLQYASIVGTIALIFSIIVIVVEMPFYLKEYTENNIFPSLFKAPNWGYLDTFSIFMFGFSSQNGVLQIFAELSNPSEKRNNKVLRRSFIIEIILYLSIAYFGFFSTFYDTPEVFLYREDLKSYRPDYFIKVAKITLFICLHCTMAINYNIMRMSWKTLWFDGKDIPFVKDFLLMFITYSLCNIGVYFIKSVIQVIGIMGGFCTVVLCYINPILIHIDRSGLKKNHNKNLFRYFVLILISFLGFAAAIKSAIDMFTKKS